jgi:glucose/arabinose dehydrogenase
MQRKNIFTNNVFPTLLAVTLLFGSLAASSNAGEEEYYKLHSFPLPDGMVLETSGIAPLKNGKVLVASRRGEIFMLDGAYGDVTKAKFNRWTFGLSQPLGLLEHEGWIYAAQRGELTRMKDSNNDGIADVFETVSDGWEISGNYHEYAFGPRLDKDGKLWVSLNKPFGGEPYGRAHWRGWAVRIDPKTGKMDAMCNGLRSPAGIGSSPKGEIFYTDNQGEWCNASKLSHLEFGDFHGHPHGLPTTTLPEIPKELQVPKPGSVPSGTYMKDLKKTIPNFKMPVCWFPYNKMGKSPSGMTWDTSGGKFGPFNGQLFVADQSGAMVMRVFMEKVGGRFQGVCFPFREGFQTGLIRIDFANNPKTGQPVMFAGGSNRGWGGRGSKPWNFERLEWTGKLPFEVHEMLATPAGFELTFTQPVDKKSAADPASYTGESYTYKLQSRYGGPEDDKQPIKVTEATVAADGKSVRLVVEPLRAGYVHEMHFKGIKNTKGEGLLHTAAYYTLVHIPTRKAASK